MNEKILALLLHDQDEPLSSLKSALANLSVETTRARTCAEAFNELQRRVKPHLVFTDVTLPDGTWADVLRLPRKAFALVDVIVVARVVDMRSEEHTSELQSHHDLVCRLLLEKKKYTQP